jgi:hypothetical protein
MAQFQVFSTKYQIPVALCLAPDLETAIKRAKRQFALFDHIDEDDAPFVMAPERDIKDATLERHGWSWSVTEKSAYQR